MTSFFVTLLIILSLISQVLAETSCGDLEKYWCGNVCTKEGFTCNCGTETFTTRSTNTKICCTDTNETCKVNHKQRIINCNNGTLQESGTLCSKEQCLLCTSSHVSVPCTTQEKKIECSEPKPCDQICRGLINTCSQNQTSEIEYCSKNRECYSKYYEKCSLLPSAKFKHYEWFKIKNDDNAPKDYFDCLNRIDQWGKIFNKRLFKSRPEVPLLNLQLNYDSQKFMCNSNYSVQWTRASLIAFKIDGDVHNCKLNDETMIKGSKLLEYLIKDQSFNPRINRTTDTFRPFQNFLKTFESDYYGRSKGSFQCPGTSKYIPRHEVCDGVPQCPNMADESWSLCNKTFPSTATLKCLKKGLGHLTFYIKATLCNGIGECIDDEDEQNCGQKAIVLIITFGSSFLFCFCVAIVIVKISKKTETEVAPSLTQSFVDEDEQTQKNIIVTAQQTKQRKLMNQIIFQVQSKVYRGMVPETLNGLKRMFDPMTYSNIVEDNAEPSFLNNALAKVKGLFHRPNQSQDFLDFKSNLTQVNHASENLANVLSVKQSSDQRQAINALFYDWELEQHHGDILEAHECIKDMTNRSALDTIIQDHTSENESFIARLRLLPRQWFSNGSVLLKLTYKLFSNFTDIVKDVFLVVALGALVKGGSFFLTWAFGSLVGCLAIPYLLASLNLALNPLMFPALFNCDLGKFGNVIVLAFLLPFLPFILIICEHKTMLELSHCTETNVENLIKRYKMIKAQTARFIKTELGIETTLQFTFSLLLSFFSISKTRTSQGLEALFQEGGKKSKILIQFGIDPVVLVIINNLWTCFSAWRTFVKGLSTNKEHFPASSKAILALYVAVSILIRATVSILFLTPCLGLFHLLRHFQGELLPYWIAMDQDVVEIYYSTAVPVPMKDLSRFDYTDKANPIPPDVTIYTYFNEQVCLIGYWCLMVLQSILIMAFKKYTNPKAFDTYPKLQMVSHALENCQVPSPLEDWDDYEGSISAYKLRQECVSKEMKFTMLTNLLVHLIMMIPMTIFAINVHSRQQLLEKSIGAFPEETEAYELTWKLAIGSPIALIIATFIQYCLYELYNRWFHPFADLLKGYEKDKKKNIRLEEMQNFL